MKYIRTKDGIYKNKPLEKHLGKRKGKGFEIVFKEQDIIKQADTIEELCTNFVITNQEYKVLYETSDYYVFRNSYLAHKWQIDKGLTDYCRYYGAIGTPKGLIYVAKMNEKGDLELL